MSTFYLLPPRQLLGDQVADFLNPILPGLDWTTAARNNFAELFVAAAQSHPDVFVVFRDEIPQGESAVRGLIDGFGAEPDDEVIEIRPNGQGTLTTSRWRLGLRLAG